MANPSMVMLDYKIAVLAPSQGSLGTAGAPTEAKAGSILYGGIGGNRVCQPAL